MKDFDRLANRVAVDKTTARVLGRGVHWEPKRVFQDHWQDTPVPLQPWPKDVSVPFEPGFRACRVVVVGYAGRSNGGGKRGKARWAVRCDCGQYGHFKAGYLRSAKGRANAMCPRCDYANELKMGRVP